MKLQWIASENLIATSAADVGAGALKREILLLSVVLQLVTEVTKWIMVN